MSHLRFAEVAVNVPVLRSTFHYHVPDDLTVQVGHLVQVSFRTGLQHGIVLALLDSSPIPETKPILGILHPDPVLTLQQIDLAYWLADEYRAALASCLWLLLPPGITAGRDTLVALLQADAVGDDPVQHAVISLLRRRGALRLGQIASATAMKDTPKEAWQGAVDRMVKRAIVSKQPVFVAPRSKPQVIHTATLAIHPDLIPQVTPTLGKHSRRADILEALAERPPLDIKLAEALLGTTRATLRKMVDEGLLAFDGDAVYVPLDADEVTNALIDLRDAHKHAHVLRVLARERDPVDVTWVYAQTGATAADLKRLDEEGYILLGEKQAWRDPLAKRAFAYQTPPPLTSGQAAVWERVREKLTPPPTPPRTRREEGLTPPPTQTQGAERLTPPPTSPRTRRGEQGIALDADGVTASYKRDEQQGVKQWLVSKQLWEKLKPLAREMRHKPTAAEDALWNILRGKKLGGYKFRRQHAIERFIVDFYCPQGKLIIEIDGEIHQYTKEEDALRQELLEALGLHVLRFTNEEVFASVAHVKQRILETLQQPLQTRFSPLPEFGETPGVGLTAPLPEFGETPGVGLTAPLPEFGEGLGVGLTFLLHGVTGSGKTEIYLRAIAETLEQGRTAIFLVPEIALTAQTLRRVAGRFPGQVAIIHSGLTAGERYDAWRRAKDGLVRVVVGPRSALFAPLPDLGLIILDEAHDHSYKQSPNDEVPPHISAPHYDARAVAEEIAEANDAVLIFGTATPTVEMYYRAERGEIALLHLPDRILGHREMISEQAAKTHVQPRYKAGEAQEMLIDLPPVQVVDMREELRVGNTGMFSTALHSALGAALARGEQAILFLNRRGQSTYVFCRDCGYVATCPNCDMPLTYHREGEALRCHHCGHSQPTPQNCPNCNSRRIKFFGAGTQQVEQALIAAFPGVRAIRWDADTAQNALIHDIMLQRFIDRQADVIVGTQMVAKGLDLPLVTLVGVVSADMGLALPEFRAAERTFQLLTQVAGRAGRGLLGGRVILQTYQPGSYAIAAASKHDYAGFYRQEIANRRELGYPPFRRLVRLVFRDERDATARLAAEDAARALRHELARLDMTDTELIGPAPCFLSKINKHYRWHLLLRGPDPARALDALDLDPAWYVDVDPVDLL